MDFYNIPIGFGMALAQSEAAMLRYAQLEEAEKQNILNKAHNVCAEKEMYFLVANLADDMQKAPTWVLFMHLIFLSLPKRAGIRKTANRPCKKKNNPDIRSRHRSLRASFLPESNSAHRSTAFA